MYLPTGPSLTAVEVQPPVPFTSPREPHPSQGEQSMGNLHCLMFVVPQTTLRPHRSRPKTPPRRTDGGNTPGGSARTARSRRTYAGQPAGAPDRHGQLPGRSPHPNAPSRTPQSSRGPTGRDSRVTPSSAGPRMTRATLQRPSRDYGAAEDRGCARIAGCIPVVRLLNMAEQRERLGNVPTSIGRPIHSVMATVGTRPSRCPAGLLARRRRAAR